jgi:predicted DNA-binding transcriptional regulator YafY
LVAKLSRRPRGRHNEIVRQWEIIRTLEESAHGKGLRALADQLDVTQRTIRRDLEVIERAGFMLDHITVNDERRWILKREFFHGVATRGFTLSEMCALYLSRSLVECLAGAPFRDDLASAFAKIEEALPPRLWRYIEQLPGVLASKGDAPKKRGTNVPAYLARLTDAVLEHKRVAMQYESFSSRAVKDYVIEPHRVLYGQGGLYLHAFVPIYGEIRTFAVERIKHLALLEDVFEPHPVAEAGAFPDSLGVYSGRPERVELEFTAKMTPYILERDWHRTQTIEKQPDGSVRLSLSVSVDWALRNWILSFGSDVRVIEPKRLAEQILDQLEEARRQYAPQLDFGAPDSVPAAPSSASQRKLIRVR